MLASFEHSGLHVELQQCLYGVDANSLISVVRKSNSNANTHIIFAF